MSYINDAGYVMLYTPTHPKANSLGYVREHRVIAEKYLGADLSNRKLIVHHTDGDRRNNSPSNLRLITESEHRRIHAGWKLIEGEWFKVCPGCKRFLKVTDEHFALKKRKGVPRPRSRCRTCCALEDKKRRRSPIRRSKPLSDAGVARFLKEYDQGKHPLPPEHAAALEASREDLMRKVREILRSGSNYV